MRGEHHREGERELDRCERAQTRRKRARARREQRQRWRGWCRLECRQRGRARGMQWRDVATAPLHCCEHAPGSEGKGADAHVEGVAEGGGGIARDGALPSRRRGRLRRRGERRGQCRRVCRMALTGPLQQVQLGCPLVDDGAPPGRGGGGCGCSLECACKRSRARRRSRGGEGGRRSAARRLASQRHRRQRPAATASGSMLLRAALAGCGGEQLVPSAAQRQPARLPAPRAGDGDCDGGWRQRPRSACLPALERTAGGGGGVRDSEGLEGARAGWEGAEAAGDGRGRKRGGGGRGEGGGGGGGGGSGGGSGGGGRPDGGDEAAARSREAPEPREVRSRLLEKLSQHCVKRERAGGGHPGGGSGGDMDTPCVLRVLAFATAAQLFANALTAKPRPVKALAAGSAFRSQAAGALTAPTPRTH
mmetsp:Transcript_26087/g.77763  ORF Transcript_26087/g.77763 Transcript_26087/m.77763 type:complete len:420 (-) Transcript_26087:14-1273(-)